MRTDIPCGNACDIEIDPLHEPPVVSFAPDPHGGLEVLWFCLRIEDHERLQSGEVRLVLKNGQNLLGGSNPAAYRPVIRSGQGAWWRLGPGERIDMPDGRWSAGWTVDVSDLPLDVALCYPYTMDDVTELLEECGSYWRADTIGVSQAASPIVRISNDCGEPSGMRPGLYLVARQHSGETPGSWVLDGFLRGVYEAREQAPLIWAVPLANIDGVVQGDYGKDGFPYDLNRAWGSPPMRHEVHVIALDTYRWRGRCEPVLGLDFHAPGGAETDGVYGYVDRSPRTASRMRANLAWAECISAALTPEFAAPEFARIGNYPSRWGTPSFSTFCSEMLEMPALSIETPYASVGDRVLTIDDYREIGRRMAQGVLANLRHPGRP